MALMKAVVPLALMTLAAAGCASGPTTTARSSSPESTATVTASSPQPVPSPAGPVIDVTIAAGAVTPTNAQVDAVVGQPITLAVSSDAGDSIHVHSVPEHVFDVAPQSGQRFEFTVQVPGNVDVELHDLHRTIVTIAVRP